MARKSRKQTRRRAERSKVSLPTVSSRKRQQLKFDFTPRWHAYTADDLRQALKTQEKLFKSTYTRQRTPARTEQRSQPSSQYTAVLQHFGVPIGGPPVPEKQKRKKQVDVCVTRQERREVLHALNHTGKVGQKRPRWTEKSRLKCGGKK